MLVQLSPARLRRMDTRTDPAGSPSPANDGNGTGASASWLACQN
jgi:hypothetical protein